MNAFTSYTENFERQGGFQRTVRLGIPKGRMEKGVVQLLAAAGIEIAASERTYRPVVSLENFETKILKPQKY